MAEDIENLADSNGHLDAFDVAFYERGIREENLPTVQYHLSERAARFLVGGTRRDYAKAAERISPDALYNALQKGSLVCLHPDTFEEHFFGLIDQDSSHWLDKGMKSLERQHYNDILEEQLTDNPLLLDEEPVVHRYVVSFTEKNRGRPARLTSASIEAPVLDEICFSELRGANIDKVICNRLNGMSNAGYRPHGGTFYDGLPDK